MSTLGSFSELPLSTCQEILDCLDVRDVLRLSCCNHTWNRMIDDDDLWWTSRFMIDLGERRYSDVIDAHMIYDDTIADGDDVGRHLSGWRIKQLYAWTIMDMILGLSSKATDDDDDDDSAGSMQFSMRRDLWIEICRERCRKATMIEKDDGKRKRLRLE